MLANFSAYKRHWRLFQGLRQVSSPLRVVLAGRPWGGRSKAALIREADAFGVAGRIEIISDPSDEEVVDLMHRARLFCAMSHKEGSYIAVAEAMLADTPVAMFEDALIGSKAFVNDQTGILLHDRAALGPQLVAAVAQAPLLRPATWAAKEISAEASSARFNSLLREHAKSRGEEWTVDVSPFYCRNFDFSYEDRSCVRSLSGEYHRLDTEWGITIDAPDAIAT